MPANGRMGFNSGFKGLKAKTKQKQNGKNTLKYIKIMI
jgi:hypothetical protein